MLHPAQPFIWCTLHIGRRFGSEGKASACNAGDLGSIVGQEDHLVKEMATPSSILAWKIPWTEKPGRLQSMGWQRVRHNWATSQQDDNIQPWHTPFAVWNQSVFPYPVLTIVSWSAYRSQVRWSGIPISLRIFHSLLWSTQSKVWRSQTISVIQRMLAIWSI